AAGDSDREVPGWNDPDHAAWREVRLDLVPPPERILAVVDKVVDRLIDVGERTPPVLAGFVDDPGPDPVSLRRQDLRGAAEDGRPLRDRPLRPGREAAPGKLDCPR